MLPVLRLDSRHWHVPERPSRGQMLFDVGKCTRFSLVRDSAEPGVALAVSRLPLPCKGEGMEPVVGKGRVLGTVVPR